MSKVWLVTGSSRGLGRSFAEAALSRGDKVAATARDTGHLDELVAVYGDAVLPLELDVTDKPAVFAGVKRAKEHFGRLDVIVNNAGYGLFGAVEELTEQQLRDQLETNLFGAIWVVQAVLPYLRAQGSGHIIQMSSIGGLIALPAGGGYLLSKWALEALNESLAHEVAGFGIRVTLVEPGSYATGSTGGVHAKADPGYDGARQSAAAFMKKLDVGDPAAAATALLRVVDSDRPPLRVFFGIQGYEIIRPPSARTAPPSPGHGAKAIDEDPGRPAGSDHREGDDRVRTLSDRQLAGVIVHVSGGEFAIRDFPGSGDIEFDFRERLGVADGDHVQRRFRRAVGELVDFREGLLWIGHDREGTAAAGHHDHPRMVRRLQQRKERVRDSDRSVHVGVVDGTYFTGGRVCGRNSLPWRAGVVDQHVQPVGVLPDQPYGAGHRLVRGHVQRYQDRLHATVSQLVGSGPPACFIARAEKDRPALFPEPPGRLKTKSLVASGDQHRGLFRVCHAR
jgi:NAD(P)-dependent dehydrogenase (short-subunit alcohol dehydrogenase family)